MPWYPKFNPDEWNKPGTIDENNCYSYSIDVIKPGNDGKHQPGHFSGFERIQPKDYNCKAFYKRIKKDIPGTYQEHFRTPCKKGFHKIFLAITDTDDEDHRDYHFYRGDNNGLYSHKPGLTKVRRTDESGNLIYNPLLANRKTPSYDYNVGCPFM